MPHTSAAVFAARLVFSFRFDAVSPYLPRIPGEWGYCFLFIGYRWRGYHNSTASCKTCATGFRHKSMDGREQVSLFPHAVVAPSLPRLGQGLRRSLGQLVHHLPKLAVLAARPCRCSHGSCACNTVYSVVEVRVKDKGKMRPSPYAAETGFCLPMRSKIFSVYFSRRQCSWRHSGNWRFRFAQSALRSGWRSRIAKGGGAGSVSSKYQVRP